MFDHLMSKIVNLCFAYMEVAGGVPMRGVSRSGSLVKLSNSHAKAGPMSVANALGLAGVSRLDLTGPAPRILNHNQIRSELISDSLD